MRLSTFGSHEFVDRGASVSFENMFAISETVAEKGNHGVEVFSEIIGWGYFFSWAVSIYPQLYTNWKRKSVVGLSFDFVTLNIIGFTLYALFNCGLYWLPEIKREYMEKHPNGKNPVHLDDVAFSVHATVLYIFIVTQCLIYERGGQRTSLIGRTIATTLLLISLVGLILPFFKVISWLDFLYICSYIKLSVTMMKYIPQAIMNFKRKSTSGFSIGSVLFDFAGGVLSMSQMIIIAINDDDWDSIFGDLTKFGLGVFTVMFDLIFMTQHYILYRPSDNDTSGASAS